MKALLALSTLYLQFFPCISKNYSVFYQWKQIEFDFPPSVDQTQLKANGKLIPENIGLTALKFLRDGRIVVFTSRWLAGIPITMGIISSDRRNGSEGPKIKPYPNYWFQTEGDCDCRNSLQSVETGELDSFGRLWIADVGRTKVLTTVPNNFCPAKLILIDPNNGDRIEHIFEFPSDVVSRTRNELRGITVACRNPEDRMDCVVYVSNLGESKLAVYDYKNGISWKIGHPKMEPDLEDASFILEGTEKNPVNALLGIDGIALSPDFKTLYFTKFSGQYLYAIPTDKISNKPIKGNMLGKDDVVTLGKLGHADGLAMDCKGILYYGHLTDNSVKSTQTGPHIKKLGAITDLAKSNKDLLWIDTWSFDYRGGLYFVTDKFHLYENLKLNPNEYNFRIIKLDNVKNVYPFYWPITADCM